MVLVCSSHRRIVKKALASLNPTVYCLGGGWGGGEWLNAHLRLIWVNTDHCYVQCEMK